MPLSIASQDAETRSLIDFVSQCRNKQLLIQAYLAFARRHFQTVAVFAVHRYRVLQCLGGDGVNFSMVNEQWKGVSLDEPTLMRRCVLSLSPYRGPIPIGEDDKALFLGFLHEIPDESWIYPAAVGDWADTLFYAERPIGDAARATDRLEFIIGKVVLALRRMMIEQLLTQVP